MLVNLSSYDLGHPSPYGDRVTNIRGRVCLYEGGSLRNHYPMGGGGSSFEGGAHSRKYGIVFQILLKQYLKEREFKWPNPEPSTSHPGHFQTFMEVERIDKDFISTGDTGLPCTINVDKCPCCPSYIFMSDTEKRKHMSVLHSDKGKDGGKVCEKEYKCLFIEKAKEGGSIKCNLTFKSANQLKEHKEQAKHVIKQNKRKAASKQPLKMKQLRLESCSSTENRNDDLCNETCQVCMEKTSPINTNNSIEKTSPINTNNSIEKTPSINTDNSIEKDDTVFIQCEKEECQKWYHLECIESAWPEKPFINNKTWYCCE